MRLSAPSIAPSLTQAAQASALEASAFGSLSAAGAVRAFIPLWSQFKTAEEARLGTLVFLGAFARAVQGGSDFQRFAEGFYFPSASAEPLQKALEEHRKTHSQWGGHDFLPLSTSVLSGRWLLDLDEPAETLRWLGWLSVDEPLIEGQPGSPRLFTSEEFDPAWAQKAQEPAALFARAGGARSDEGVTIFQRFWRSIQDHRAGASLGVLAFFSQAARVARDENLPCQSDFSSNSDAPLRFSLSTDLKRKLLQSMFPALSGSHQQPLYPSYSQDTPPLPIFKDYQERSLLIDALSHSSCYQPGFRPQSAVAWFERWQASQEAPARPASSGMSKRAP